jgi:hypothetical protein
MFMYIKIIAFPLTSISVSWRFPALSFSREKSYMPAAVTLEGSSKLIIHFLPEGCHHVFLFLAFFSVGGHIFTWLKFRTKCNKIVC